MIMYAKLYCNRCKRYRRFVWQEGKTYLCPMCGKIKTLPEGYFFPPIV
jgi:Zn finger protein HypA/HybF involved in hydrogenase expression